MHCPDLPRREYLLTLAAFAVQAGTLAGSAHAAPRATQKAAQWTTGQEQAAARQSAELIAEKTGEAPHPSIGEILVMDKPVPLLNGQSFDMRLGQHKLLLVFAWASWCPICKQLAPRLQQFWREHQARGLGLLSISTDTEPSLTKASIRKFGYTFPVAMASSVPLAPSFGIRSLPTLWVRSARGVIVAAEEGNLDRDDLKALLAHL